jgi:hypothetical protein
VEVDDVEDDENQEEEDDDIEKEYDYDDHDVECENVEECDERIILILWKMRYIESDEIKGEEDNNILNEICRRRKIKINILIMRRRTDFIFK